MLPKPKTTHKNVYLKLSVLFIHPSHLCSFCKSSVFLFVCFFGLFFLCFFLPKWTDLRIVFLFLPSYIKNSVCFAFCLFPYLMYPANPSIVACKHYQHSFFFFLNSCVMFCWMCNHSPLFANLGSFQNFEVINNAAVNNIVHMYLHTVKIYLQNKFLEVRLLRWRVN